MKKKSVYFKASKRVQVGLSPYLTKLSDFHI